MKNLLAALTCCLAVPALAHIKLLSPDNFQITDTFGSPNKAEPCGGAGTATNMVTEVVAGSTLTVTWSEPILHPGHFRIGIAQAPADFSTPTPVLSNANTNCASAPIDTTPSYPTIVDGLFPHTAANPGGNWTTTVTVPMMSCDHCVLQVMQFMSSHAPPCFYYQCATLKIVMPDAGVPAVDAGVADAGATMDAGVTDAGANTGGGGGSAAGGGGGSMSTGGGAATGGGSSATGGGSTSPVIDAGTGGGMATAGTGCGCTSTPFLGVLLTLTWWLRRRSAR